MTVCELYEYLEEMMALGREDHEVMIAHQPAWPLAEVISQVVDSQTAWYNEYGTECNERDEEAAEDPAAGEFADVVWIVAGGHHDEKSPYAPSCIFSGQG